MHDTEAITPELAGLCTGFLRADPDARGWASVYPDESEWESPDCDVMSERFLSHAKAEGFDGFSVRAESTDEGQHWFAVVLDPASGRAVAVYWTARQFHNAGHPAPPAVANETYVRNLLALSRATPALTVMVFNDRAPASTRRRSGR